MIDFLAVATVGFKLDTVFASIRSAFESTGKLTTVLEEKITPNMSFQVFNELIVRLMGSSIMPKEVPDALDSDSHLSNKNLFHIKWNLENYKLLYGSDQWLELKSLETIKLLD